MKIMIQQVFAVSAALTASLLFSASAFAMIPPPVVGDGEGFAELYERASGDGRCDVAKFNIDNATLFMPIDPETDEVYYNVLVWGNGSGMSPNLYSTLLTSIASHCIVVAAANSTNAGSGVEMQEAFNTLSSTFGMVLGPDLKICTAGHSQGGGGAFNAANLIGTDCVIAMQPDTRFSASIDNELDAEVEVIALWAENDGMASASDNRNNVLAASSILTQVETEGEGHYAPLYGRGGIIGTMLRMASIALLSDDPSLSAEFRKVFWGPVTTYTVTPTHPDIHDVRRDYGAVNATP